MKDKSRMPVLFAGHGSPINAIEDNVFRKGFQKMGEKLEKPSAILAVSSHWPSAGHTKVQTAGEMK